MKKVELFESFIAEGFEVHYSDGVRAAKKFKTEKDALSFTKEKIASGKCKEIAIYKDGPGFHSTADTEAVIAWWGDGSYLDNVSKKDSKLAAKKINESVVTEAKAKGLDWVIGELGDKPKCYNVASFVYDNYDKVTGLRKSMRNDEMDFPDEIMDVVDHYGLDIDEFTDCYGMAAESVVTEGVVSIKGGRIIAHKVLNKLVDMGLIPVRKKSEELLETIAEVITNAKMESVEVNEAMFKAKDYDKTLITYAIDTKADEIYVIKVAKVIQSGFPDVSTVPDKRFHGMFGMMLEENWMKQYDKLPEAGDILPAPRKDKAFESKVNEGAMSDIDLIAKEAKDFKSFVKEFKKEYKNMDAGSPKELEAWLQSVYDSAKTNESVVSEAVAPAGLTKAETKKVAETYAKAISKHDGCKCTVNAKSLEEDSFDLDIDGEAYAGGSYMITADGDVINAALPEKPVYGQIDSTVDQIIKNLKK